jgi:putative flavoprotein involved in K+ transport
VHRQQVSEWLSSFGAALDRADYDAALQMFEEESYWRDLVALTWNIRTLEGKESIRAMLKVTVPEAKPGQLLGEAPGRARLHPPTLKLTTTN